MTRASFTCGPDAIARFLDERLNEAEQSSFERHLDECDSCCEQLREMTAEQEQWSDVQAYLSSTTTLSESLIAATTASEVSLDFLNPTDDPRMLGRFGAYEIAGVIGVGGMGIVLKGFDQALNRYAAIKVLAPHYASNGAARKRFAREARAAAAVVHDNVVAIHGVDESSRLPYLVMPYIRGESLQKRLDRVGPLAVDEVLRIAMQTALGLAAAHDQGLVHRDIKPANILLPENVERVMITDFGLARAADDASLTRSGVIAGTPQYMSPEQARGEAIDGRSDLFSLGCVMYATCTGRVPFRAETPLGVLRRIVDEDPRAIREINANVPDWLCRIIDRLLAKSQADRYQSADEVAQLLKKCLAHVREPVSHALPDGVGSSSRDSRKRNRWWWVAIAGVASACAVTAVVVTQLSLLNLRRAADEGSLSPQPSPRARASRRALLPGAAEDTKGESARRVDEGPPSDGQVADTPARPSTAAPLQRSSNIPGPWNNSNAAELNHWDDGLDSVLRHIEHSLDNLEQRHPNSRLERQPEEDSLNREN